MRSTESDSRAISVMRLSTGTRSEKSRPRMRSVLPAMRESERDSSSAASSAPTTARPTATAAARAARSSRTCKSADSSTIGTAAAI